MGWGTHVNLWLIHVNVWQKPLQYCKVISLQIKINEKNKLIKSAVIPLPLRLYLGSSNWLPVGVVVDGFHRQ